MSHHNGYVEVSICQEDIPDIDCFNVGRMNRAPSNTAWMQTNGWVMPINNQKPWQIFLPPLTNGGGNGCNWVNGQHGGLRVRATMLLPPGLEANKMATLRWRYVTGNSCVPPGFMDFFKNGPEASCGLWYTQPWTMSQCEGGECNDCDPLSFVQHQN